MALYKTMLLRSTAYDDLKYLSQSVDTRFTLIILFLLRDIDIWQKDSGSKIKVVIQHKVFKHNLVILKLVSQDNLIERKQQNSCTNILFTERAGVIFFMHIRPLAHKSRLIEHNSCSITQFYQRIVQNFTFYLTLK